jgi:hypothetical protein
MFPFQPGFPIARDAGAQMKMPGKPLPGVMLKALWP